MAITKTASVLDTVTDFLAGNPTPQQILDYQLPDAVREYALHLLEMNRDGTLSEEGRSEMEEFMQIDTFISLLKGKIRLNQRRER